MKVQRELQTVYQSHLLGPGVTGVARPSGAHGQGTLRGPQTNGISLVGESPGPSGPLEIVHPVHPLATP